MVAYGAHHRATGKATYSSVSVYAGGVSTVGLGTVQSPRLQGSAGAYISDQPNADMFYAWTFARTGGPIPSDLHVSTIPDANVDFCGTPDRPVDLRTLRVGFRAYMEPPTKVRPAEPELLMDRLLLFTSN